jgi:PAS domain S-box-containing protein
MPQFLQQLWSTGLGMCIIDNQAYIHDVNLAFSASLGYSSRELIGRDMARLLAKGNGGKHTTLRKQFTDKRYTITQGIWRLPVQDDHMVSLCVLGSWITKHSGQLYKLVATINAACCEEGQVLLESHILKTGTSSKLPDHAVSPQPPRAELLPIQPAQTQSLRPQLPQNETSQNEKPQNKESQQTVDRLCQRINELEGKVAAYRAILERYNASGNLTASASSWYAKLGKD